MTPPQECYVISVSPAVADQIEKAKKLGLRFKIDWMPFDEPRPTYSETLEHRSTCSEQAGIQT